MPPTSSPRYTTPNAKPNAASTILDLVRSLQRELGLTVVYVTHRVSEARRLGGRAVILVEGAVEEAGDTEAVLAQSRSAKVISFLHGETAPEERPT